MKTSHTSLARWALAVSASLAFFGCTTSADDSDETQDGGNVVFVQEAKTMANVDGSASFMNDTTTNPVTLEKVIIALHYEAACQCYVRSTAFTNTKKGFGRSRTDSIWLFAGGHVYLDSFAPSHADSIVHVRHVKRIDGHSGKDVDVTARTTLVRRQTDSGVVYLWFGTFGGNFKGREIAGSTFSLTRKFISLNNGFGVPLGNMFVKRGPYDLVFVFNADGTAHCTVRKGDKIVRVTHINQNDEES